MGMAIKGSSAGAKLDLRWRREIIRAGRFCARVLHAEWQ